MEENRENIQNNRESADPGGYSRDRQGNEAAELPSLPDDEKDGGKKDHEFARGTVFGLLIGACFFMAFLLFRYGTIGSRNNTGASVLTSSSLENKLREVEEIIKDEYYYDVDGTVLEDGLFKGVAYGLTDHDRYADYYSARELEEIEQQNQGEYRGIGVTITQDPDSGTVTVHAVTAGSPADEAGIKEGDILLKVNGTDVTGMDVSAIADMITGSEDSVKLTISRDGKEMEFSVTPDQVETAPVEYRMLDSETGYLKIPEFDSVTTQQFKDALTSLMDDGMDRLVIDLRGNPGGLLDVVANILDQLLPEGKIVTTQKKNGEDSVIYSDEEQMYTGDLAVLVDGSSASGSELFAGAIQDYALGPVVGEQTYGKGVVQTTYGLSDGSAFKLTTDKYLTAGGQDIDGVGITPDIKVSSDEALDAALDALQNGWTKDETAESVTENGSENVQGNTEEDAAEN